MTGSGDGLIAFFLLFMRVACTSTKSAPSGTAKGALKIDLNRRYH